jgi:hypothetical protein
MTRSDVLSYPLIMLVSAGLCVWVVLSSFRGPLPVQIGIYEQLIGVALLLAGFGLSAVLDVTGRRRASRSTRKLTQVEAFNPTLIHEVVHLHLEVPSQKHADVHQWELTSASLVGQDNSLALAKLRLDIEQTLREMMLIQGLDAARARASAVKMAELLAERNVLPRELVEPIHQIVTVCNQAIHGSEVSDDLADSVVSVGDELLARLRWLIETDGRDARDPASVAE